MDTHNGRSQVQTVCLVILAVAVAAFSLHWLKPVLIPFVLAIFLAIAMTPLVSLLAARCRLPRGLAVAITLVLGAVVLFVIGVLVSASVAEMASNASGYQARAQEMIDRAVDSLPLDKWGVSRDQVLQPLSQFSGQKLRELLLATSGALGDVLSNGVLMLIFLCFLMFGGNGFAGSRGGNWAEIEKQIRRYVGVKLLVSAVTGILVGAILMVLGIDFAIMFGLLAFLLNFIPSVGSIIAVLLPIPVVLVSPDVTTTTAVLAIALPGMVEFVIGNIIEPKLMARSFDLHPIVILMALVFWGLLWGIVGMLLAVPMTAVVRLLLSSRDDTRPIAELLSGRVADKNK